MSGSSALPPGSLARRLLLLFRLRQPRRLNSIPSEAARARSQGRAGCCFLLSPGHRGQSSSALRAVSRPWLGVGVGGRGGGGGGGVRGGAVPLRLRRPVPASAPGSRTLRREGEGAAGPSRGFLTQPGVAGWRRSCGAGGRPSLPGSSRRSAPDHVDGLWRKPTPGKGGENRLGPPLTGGATPAGDGGGSPGLPSRLLRE